MKKRILSMLCSIAILCTMMVSVVSAETLGDSPKKVDGSYLTHESSSTGKSTNSLTRGEYLMTGECSISNAGLTRIYAYGATVANRTVNYMQTLVYVDQYNEDTEKWDQIYAWKAEAENDYFMSTDAVVTVEPGYYYRVRAIHIAGDQYPYDETASVTDGIYVPPLT